MTDEILLPMVSCSERKPSRAGWKACRTDCMAVDEFWFYYYENGSWYSYGTFCGMKVRREHTNIVAWRNLTLKGRKNMEEGKYDD